MSPSCSHTMRFVIRAREENRTAWKWENVSETRTNRFCNIFVVCCVFQIRCWYTLFFLDFSLFPPQLKWNEVIMIWHAFHWIIDKHSSYICVHIYVRVFYPNTFIMWENSFFWGNFILFFFVFLLTNVTCECIQIVAEMNFWPTDFFFFASTRKFAKSISYHQKQIFDGYFQRKHYRGLMS